MNDDKPYRPAKYKTAPVTAGSGSADIVLQRLAALERALTAIARALSVQKPNDVAELKSELTAILEALNGLQLNPKIHVSAPEAKVTVPPLDLTRLESAIASLKLPEPTEPQAPNVFVDEKFDEYRVEYYDDDDDRPIATRYYLDGKQVAKVTYSYNREGNLTGAKKA